MKKKFFLVLLLSFVVFQISSDKKKDQQYFESRIIEKVSDLEESYNNTLLKIENEYVRKFENYIDIMTILIGFLSLLSIVLPLITYLFGIKPVSEIETRIIEMEKNIEDYAKNRIIETLKSQENYNKTDAISNLYSDEPEIKLSGINYLYNCQYQVLEDELEEYVYESLMNPSLGRDAKTILSILLSTKISKYGDDFFNFILEKNEIEIYFQFFSTYLILKDILFSDFRYKMIHEYDESKGYSLFLRLIYSNMTRSVDFVNMLLNDTDTIDNFAEANLKHLKTSLDLQNIDYNDTYFGNKVQL